MLPNSAAIALPARAATTTATSSVDLERMMSEAKSLFWSWLASSSDLKDDPEKREQGAEEAKAAYGKADNWFQKVTGTSLGGVLLAIWKLILWVAMAIFKILWTFVAWIMSVLPQE